MSFKPKTVRRVMLLGLVAIVVGGTLFALLVVRRWQGRRLSDSYAAEALAAQARNDPFVAQNAAGSFIKRARADDPRLPDMLKIYADTSVRIELPEHKNIPAAVAYYRRYLSARPDDRAARLALLDLFSHSDKYRAEMLDLAEELLPKDLGATTTNDLPALRAAAQSLVETNAPDKDTGPVLRRLETLAPLDIADEKLRLRLAGPAAGRARAESLLSEHPGDRRAELLAVAAGWQAPHSGEGPELWRRMCRVAGLDAATGALVGSPSYPDAAFTRSLVEMFDLLPAFECSLQVLAAAPPDAMDPLLRRVLLRRLWQESRFQDVIDRSVSLDPASWDSPAESLGFRGLSLWSLKRPGEAIALADSLRKREGDFRAAAWSEAVVLANPDSKVPSRDRVARLRDIVRACPDEPCFQFLLGDALTVIRRSEEARKFWAQADRSPVAVSWVLPAIRITENGLAEGRIDDATKAAARALKIAPGKVAVHVLWVEVQAALVQRGATEALPVPGLLEHLDRVLRGVDDLGSAQFASEIRERLLPTRVYLTARSGDLGGARSLALGALHAAQPLSEDTLHRLIAVSELEKLDLAAECLARAEMSFGRTAGVALGRALEMAVAGDKSGGLKLLQDEVASHRDDVSYQIALARYSEQAELPGATQAWISLGDAHPQDAVVLRACLTSSAAGVDRAFVDRLIQRYTALIGPDAGDEFAVRLARARSLMSASPTKQDRDQAVSLLSSLTASQPGLTETRLQLAHALALADPSRDIVPEVPRAVSQLQEAAAREPHNARVALELAALYQSQQEWGPARDQLVRIASDASFGADARAEAARALMAQGEPGPVAVATLAEVSAQLGDRAPPAMLLLLADAYSRLRQDDQAAKVFETLIAHHPDAEAIFAAAQFHAVRGDRARADQVLARLDSMTLPPGAKDLVLARFAADRGEPGRAEPLFESALKSAPQRVDAWQALIRFHLARADAPAALAAAERSLKAVPGDPSLTVLAETARALASQASTGNSLAALANALASDPDTAKAAQTLRLAQQAAERGELNTPEDFARLADRYPTLATLQSFVAQQIMTSSPDQAAVIAARAMAAAPSDPASARLAAQVYLRLGRWNDLLTAANAWRLRDSSRSPEPDIAIAEACLHLRDYDRGLEVMRPRLRAALDTIEQPLSLAVLNMHARLLIGAGHEAEAREFLFPLLSKSRNVRVGLWLALCAADLPLPEAESWIAQVRPLLPADSADEQLALATAFNRLAGRFPGQSEPLLAVTREVLTALADRPATATAPVMESLGVLRHRAGDVPGAEAAYRRALDLEPNRPIALNNLANIELEKGHLDAALGLARRATQSTPIADPAHLDTLGQVYQALAERNGATPESARSNHIAAAESFLAVARIVRDDPNIMTRAGSQFERGGDLVRAAATYETALQHPQFKGATAATVKNSLAAVLLRLHRTEDLPRARSMAWDATVDAPQPAHFETLGWAELALGRKPAAAEAFRKALVQTPFPSAQVGLATCLLEGGADDRAEATRLLRAVKPDSLDDLSRASWERACSALGLPATAP